MVLRGTSLLIAILAVGCRAAEKLPPPAAAAMVGRAAPSPIAKSGAVTITDAGGIEPSLKEAIVLTHEAWLTTDARTYVDRMLPSAVRVQPQWGRVDQSDFVVEGAKLDWTTFERPAGRVGMKMSIRDVAAFVDGDVASVVYTVDVVGKKSIRWSYDDQWLVFQSFVRTQGHWFLAFETRAVDLGGTERESRTSFDFDFAVPVTDLKRAVAFYTPILGAPEVVTDSHATFAAGGPRFHLDGTKLGGLAEVRLGMPNGYGIFYVHDVHREVRRLVDADVDVDKRGVGFDPSGNPFVLRAKPSHHDGAAEVPEVTSDFTRSQKAIEIMRAWMGADDAKLARYLSDESVWFDDRRSHAGEVARGRDAIIASAARAFRNYDRSPGGIAARLKLRDAVVRQLNSAHSVLVYRADMSARGERGFRESAYVTQLWKDLEGPHPVALSTVITKLSDSTNLALALDYTGYPELDLNEARTFYGETLRLGEPYRDDAWFGFWSNHVVFGVFGAKPARDRLPVPRRANGYPSFLVLSAHRTAAYLRQQKVSFPVIPAINTTSFVEALPGYTQIVSTDSEGNLIAFTEYSGQ